MNELILETLKELEIELHHKQTRSNSERLNELLHNDFVEVGRSGRKYSKTDIVIELIAKEETNEVMISSDYEVRPLAANAALLTYKSAVVDELGARNRHALRSSVWLHNNDSWQLTYHQATPTE